MLHLLLSLMVAHFGGYVREIFIAALLLIERIDNGSGVKLDLDYWRFLASDIRLRGLFERLELSVHISHLSH